MRAPAAAALAALLAACAPQPTQPPPEGLPAEFPAAYYEQLRAQGKPVYQVDPARSLVVIEVHRGGTLASLGHDHVVSARNVRGYVAPDAGRADLHVALHELVVDEPALRAAAGMATQPSEADIAGTRANMLEKVLETDRFPHALVKIDDAVTITLHGVTRAVNASRNVERNERQVTATGSLAFDQTDFGITPYSVLGGRIAVRDRLVLRYEIRAERLR